MPNRLGDLIRAAFHGTFPPADGGVTVLGPPSDSHETVLAFTGHAAVATALAPQTVTAQHPDGFGGAVAPGFLVWLAGEHGRIGTLDVVMVAAGLGNATLPPRDDTDAHPRVQHARSLRDAVAVYGDERGIVTLGSGIGGIAEISVEVEPHRRNAGVGRSLITDARGLMGHDEVVVAEIAPGNAQSLRAFLACGFTPIGAAVHIQPGRRG